MTSPYEAYLYEGSNRRLDVAALQHSAIALYAASQRLAYVRTHTYGGHPACGRKNAVGVLTKLRFVG